MSVLQVFGLGEGLSNAEQAFLNIAGDTAADAAPWGDVVRGAFARIDRLFKLGPGGLSGLPTGLHNLDHITRGLRPAEMTVLAARPSMGKTSLAMNIAEAVAFGRDLANRPFKGDHGRPHPVAVFSLEMSAEALALRMLCGRAGVSAHKIEAGLVNNAAAARQLTVAAADFNAAPLFVDDAGGLST